MGDTSHTTTKTTDHSYHFPKLAKLAVTTLLLSLNLIGHAASQSNNTDLNQTPDQISLNGTIQISLRGHHHRNRNRTHGRWEVLQQTIGIVAMHMAVTRFNTVVMFDQTGAGPSRYRLPRRLGSGANGSRCTAETVDADCFAHSLEYDIATNQVRAMNLQSDPWFSTGAFLSNGTLLSVGGYSEGSRSIRRFSPCEGGGPCDWVEDIDNDDEALSEERWYSAAIMLPDREDRVMVVGGRNAFSYEFVPKRNNDETSFTLPLLTSSYSLGRSSSRRNLYPFVHLSPDGNVFIFAVRDSILFDYKQNRVVRTFPRIPGAGHRTYPSTGSSVLLPLDHTSGFQHAEIMICGGAASGAYRSARRKRTYANALRTCGRIEISSPEPRWHMERMPRGRVMGDMIVLPTGEVLIINGAERGAAGWDSGRKSSRRPYLYSPRKRHGRRFATMKATKVPRMYRSSAVLLPDGRVLVGGSNPHSRYRFDHVKYRTELRLQAFIPHYMEPHYDHRRPSNVEVGLPNNNITTGVLPENVNSTVTIRYGEEFVVSFSLGSRLSDDVVFAAYAPPFAAHSTSTNQRLLRLRANSVVGTDDSLIAARVIAPPNGNVAPPGYYMLTVVNGGVPSLSTWIRFTYH